MIFFLGKQDLRFHAKSIGDNLPEMSNPIFWENKKNISKCHLLKILVRVLSVNKSSTLHKFQTCPDGYYSGAAEGSCSQCPAGQYCFDGSNVISPADCSAGYYSPLGQSTCTACTQGKYEFKI